MSKTGKWTSLSDVRGYIEASWLGFQWLEAEQEVIPETPIHWITRNAIGKGPYCISIALLLKRVTSTQIEILPHALGNTTQTVEEMSATGGERFTTLLFFILDSRGLWLL